MERKVQMETHRGERTYPETMGCPPPATAGEHFARIRAGACELGAQEAVHALIEGLTDRTLGDGTGRAGVETAAVREVCLLLRDVETKAAGLGL